RWLLAVPNELEGGILAVILLAMAVALTPIEKRRRLITPVLSAVRCLPLILAPGEAWGGGSRIRLRLPSPFLRIATVVVAMALIVDDPSLDYLFSAKAVCTIPPNFSTETTRITEMSYDFEGRLSQINTPEGAINYDYDLATGRLTETCTQN